MGQRRVTGKSRRGELEQDVWRGWTWRVAVPVSGGFWWVGVALNRTGKSRRRSRLVSTGLSLVPVSKPRMDGWVYGPVARRRAEAVTADPASSVLEV